MLCCTLSAFAHTQNKLTNAQAHPHSHHTICAGKRAQEWTREVRVTECARASESEIGSACGQRRPGSVAGEHSQATACRGHFQPKGLATTASQSPLPLPATLGLAPLPSFAPAIKNRTQRVRTAQCVKTSLKEQTPEQPQRGFSTWTFDMYGSLECNHQPRTNLKEVAVTAVTFAAMFVNPLKGSTLTQQRKGIVVNICSIFSMVVH